MTKLEYSVKRGGVALPLTGALTPGAVIPGEEILRNSERALDGTMTVDVVGSKKKYDLAWTLLSNADYLKLSGFFQTSSVVELTEIGSELDASGNVTPKTAKFSCVVDSLSAKPIVYGDLYWSDINVKLLER